MIIAGSFVLRLLVGAGRIAKLPVDVEMAGKYSRGWRWKISKVSARKILSQKIQKQNTYLHTKVS